MTIPLPCVRLFQGHEDAVTAVAFSPDGRLLATASLDQTIRLWDAETGNLLETLEGHRVGVRTVAFSPDGKILASGTGEAFGSGEVRLWDVSAGSIRETWGGDSDAADEVLFSPSGELLAIATGSGCGPREPIEPTVHILDAETGRTEFRLERENCLAFSPDGKAFAAGGPDGNVVLHDAETGEPIQTLSGRGNVFAVAYSADGTRLLSGGYRFGADDGAVRVWDVESGRIERTLAAGERYVTMVVPLAVGRVVATDGEGVFGQLWDVETGELLARTTEPNRRPWGPSRIAISPDGTLLTTPSDDVEGAAMLWSLAGVLGRR